MGRDDAVDGNEKPGDAKGEGFIDAHCFDPSSRVMMLNFSAALAAASARLRAHRVSRAVCRFERRGRPTASTSPSGDVGY